MKKLTLTMMNPDPLIQFSRWFDEAKQCERIANPDAMCLSTISPEGLPEGRIVLLKDVNADGFAFFTNTDSPKGLSLRHTPLAALTFYWQWFERQVRIQGSVVSISDSDADRYFSSRHRNSQIGAWSSLQSAVMDTEDELSVRFQHFNEKYRENQVPRPPYWSGYRVVPDTIEFWQGQDFRLHDRFMYSRTSENGWKIERLYP
ncbi:MAG: pyridoxamine 5'-phosphate oxidase [Candidatus Auribacterota bacterium]